MLSDNYGYLLHCGDKTLVIDPSDAEPVVSALSARGWKLDAILNTHHHWDHVGGNLALKKAYSCEVWGPEGDEQRIPGLDKVILRDQVNDVAGIYFEALFIPAHTMNHLAFWFRESQAVFTGDTLFLMGCGRLFEGTAEQMRTSLARLAKLPDETRVYCGHEYSEQNRRFALSLKVGQDRLVAREGATVPGTIGEEKNSNPYLRLEEEGFRQALYPGLNPIEAFTRLRLEKDKWN